MAEAFDIPEEMDGGIPGIDGYFGEGRFDAEGYFAAEQEFVQSLAEWARENGSGDLAGEEWRTPVGDGYARYIVFKNRPLQLIKIPTGDAWDADPIMLRGLRVSDIREHVARRAKLDEIFGRGSDAA
jgi:hypothetical protein